MNVIVNSAVAASGFYKPDADESDLVKKAFKFLNVINALSWIPILGAIVGVVRMVAAPIFNNKLQKELTFYKKFAYSADLIFLEEVQSNLKGAVAWSVIRGACEVLTLGFFAPINVIADSICSIIKRVLYK